MCGKFWGGELNILFGAEMPTKMRISLEIHMGQWPPNLSESLHRHRPPMECSSHPCLDIFRGLSQNDL